MNLKILLLEDSPADAELVALELERAGVRAEITRVVQRADFEAALETRFDLILSDYSLPQWTGMQALSLATARCPEAPFILISGAIGEELAVEAMKRGAADYLLKDRLARLGAAVEMALEKRRLRRRARHAKRRYERIFQSAIEAISLSSFDGRFIGANQALAHLLGYATPEELVASVTDLRSQLYADPTDRDRFVELLRRDGEVRDFETCYLRRDGAPIWVIAAARLVRGEGGAADYILGMAVDITARKRSEEQVARLSRVQAMLASVGSAIVRLHERPALFAEACRIAVEHGGFRMAWIAGYDHGTGEALPIAWSGIEEHLIAGRRLRTRSELPESGGLAGRAVRARRTAVENDLAANPGVGLLRAEALRRGCRSGIGLPIIADGEIVAVFILFAAEAGFFNADEIKLLETMAADVSFAVEHMARSERLRYLAHHDELTGLPNRALLIDRMTQHLPAVRRAGSRSALIVLDLDRFHAVNDSYGRSAGDELLRKIGGRLRSALRESDTVARLGSNRFAVLALDLQKESDIASLLRDKVLAPLDAKFSVAGHELHVIARAGIALYPPDGTDAETLLRNAEAALKRAKTAKESYVFYAPEINARVAERLALATRLRGALERKEFVLHYQPKVRLTDGMLCGVEALIRWQDPQKGLVPPGAFIPLLEETGLIVEVGKWAIAEALEQHRRWTQAGCRVERVAVNVSALQLRQKDFVDAVMNAVAHGGDNAEALEIEITESLLMQDFDASVRKLSMLRGIGVKVAMDDFGTGFCSLNYLARLPIDSVKIDRSFVTHIASDERGAAIVASVVALARSLKLKTVAEGVETAEQAALLGRLGCDEAQGYLYAKPLPAAEIGARYVERALA